MAKANVLDPVIEALVFNPDFLGKVVDRHVVAVGNHEEVLELLKIAVELEVLLQKCVVGVPPAEVCVFYRNVILGHAVVDADLVLP